MSTGHPAREHPPALRVADARAGCMISWWARLPGYQDIEDSRPWDLTEIVPAHETRWFRACAVVLWLLALVVIVMVFFR